MVSHSQSVMDIGKSSKADGDKKDLARQCPCCEQLIQPRMMDYLPTPGTYKQYKCEHCSAWLTIDLLSRIKLIAVATIGFLLTMTGSIELLIVMGVSFRGPTKYVYIPLALAIWFGGQHTLARYMRKIAKWVAVI